MLPLILTVVSRDYSPPVSISGREHPEFAFRFRVI